MSGNTIGNIFKLTSFGESHGAAVGGIIEGFPAGFTLDLNQIQLELDLRKPGQSSLTTPRVENDKVEFLSGLFEGKTTGTPIAFMIRNNSQDSSAYDHLKDLYRPSHADFTYEKKYGIRDHRGGGRSSARETIARVVAGAFAKQYLKAIGMEVFAYVSQVYNIVLEKNYLEIDLSQIFDNNVRCPDSATASKMIEQIELAKTEGDSLGGVVSCIVKNVSPGLGEPVFGKINAELGKAIFSIPAVKGLEFGSGFGAVTMKGSAHNDAFVNDNGNIKTRTNNSGGIQGGISNGEDIYFKVAFKPVASVSKEQETIDKNGQNIHVSIKGRHDPCVLPRAVPVVSAMTAIVLLDLYLQNKIYK
jgi:chorismate synthase